MIGATRVDENLLGMIREITKDNDLIRVESAGHNKLRWFGPGGKSTVTRSMLGSDRAVEELTTALAEVGILIRENTTQPEDLMPTLSKLLGVSLSNGSVYLLQQFIEALANDIEREVTTRSKARLGELEELISMAQEEVDTTKRDAARDVHEVERQRDEARARAERAERALANFTRAMREADSIVQGSG